MWLYNKYVNTHKVILSFYSIFIFFIIYTLFPNDDFAGMPKTHSNKLELTDYFNRFYYSVVLQTAVGFGDIVGNTDRVRFISMMQAISMMLILIV